MLERALGQACAFLREFTGNDAPAPRRSTLQEGVAATTKATHGYIDYPGLAITYPVGYNAPRMNTIVRSVVFDAWLKALRDPNGKARIVSRLNALQYGNFGDCAPVGEGVSEMRIHCGPGYRVYYTRRDRTVYLLLIAGDKSTQQRDIKAA